jgi:hypothetical protein
MWEAAAYPGATAAGIARSDALLVELLLRYNGLKQWMIAERFGGFDEGLVRHDRRAIREKIETEPKIRKWVSPG